ncbi:MAG: hypothetical protein AAB439_01760 [Patescibacteria group bacterium]
MSENPLSSRAEAALTAGQSVIQQRRKLLVFQAHHWGWFSIPAAFGGSKAAQKLEENFDLGVWEQPFNGFLGSEDIPPIPGLSTQAELLGGAVAALAFITIALWKNFKERKNKTLS